MKLLISEVANQQIQNFASSVGARVEYTSLAIELSVMHISVVFLQPEQYSRLINCKFNFPQNVSFFYEDIRAAFSSASATDPARADFQSDSTDEMMRNDKYVKEVINFCEENWLEIIEIPPFWYEKAVNISVNSIRSIFPIIADEDFRNKMRLLNIWRNDPHK